MLAAVFLVIRGACYLYIFYVKDGSTIGPIDWLFAATHVITALSLVATVLAATFVLLTKHPIANQQFDYISYQA